MTNRQRSLIVIGVTTLTALILLVILSGLDGPAPESETPPPTTELLTQEDDETNGNLATPEARQSRGWIQIANPDGTLAQQYRCAHLDPAPAGLDPGWITMDAPEVEVHRNGGVITIRGRSAQAYAPNSRIESGVIDDDVFIRVFESLEDLRAGATGPGPTMEMRTEHAMYDRVLGEVRCEGPITIETEDGVFDGENLKVYVNDRDHVIGSLRIERIEQIRLATGSQSLRTPAVSDDATPAPKAPPTPRPERTQVARETAPAQTPSVERPRPETVSADAAPLYHLTLNDDVRIRNGEGPAAVTATGDRLDMFFAMERSTQSTVPGGALGVAPSTTTALTLLSLALANEPPTTIAPPPSPDDTIVTCRGPLLMEPAGEIEVRPADDATLLRLHGAPVRLEDPEREAVAIGAELRYETGNGSSAALIGSDEHRLLVTMPEVTMTAEAIRMSPDTGRGRIVGSGHMQFTDDDGPDQLRLAWRDGADLAFTPEDDAGIDPSSALGDLDSATFIGNVILETNQGAARGPSGGQGIDLLGGRSDGAQDLTTSAPGRMTSEELTVTFHRGASDTLEPSRLIARTDVVVSGDSRTMWAPSVDVTFTEAAPDTDPEVSRVIAEGGVQLRLPNGERIFGERLTLEPNAGTAELTGSDLTLVNGNNVIDRAERITVNDETGHARIDGRGRFWRFADSILDADETGRLDHDRLGVIETLSEELRVTWIEAVDLLPAAKDAPRIVRFRGNVRVRSPELRLDGADELRVGFTPETEAADPTIDWIEADGRVLASSVDQAGEIATDHVRVELAEDESGSAIPSRMIARGAVYLADAEHEIWTERLESTFRVRETGASVREATDEDTQFSTARVELDVAHATGGVQLRLPEGNRVFADELRADAPRGAATLLGARVVVLGTDFMLDDCTRVDVDRDTGAYRAIGPGAFVAVTEPVVLPDAGARADVDALSAELAAAPRSLDATWTTAAEYHEGAALAGSDVSGIATERVGSLVLDGDVNVEADPTPDEHDRVKAERLVLDLLELENGQRELIGLSASGNAELEGRTWATADRAGKPSVMYVSGVELTFDQRTLATSIVGPGTLLLREPADDSDAGEDAAAAADIQNVFGAGGSRLFRFADRLEMTPILEDRLQVDLRGDVRAIHQGIDGSASQLACHHLIADLDRLAADGREDGTTLDLGGPVDLRRVRGEGGVFVETPGRRLWCDGFDYDVATGVAEASAVPGRKVTIQSSDAPQPATAERVLWNLTEDTIIIRRGGG